MELVIFNAALYVGTLLFYWYKRHKIDVGFMLLAIYAAIAIAGVFYYASFPNAWKLQLWSFIYLFIVNILFFRPLFFDSDTIYNRLHIRNNSILRVFVIIYSIAAFVAIYYSINRAIININSGAWKILRDQLYHGDIELYTNQTERLSKIFCGYLRPVATIILFYYLTLKKVKPLFLIILAFAIFVPSFITAINIASRGLILNLVFSLFFAYLIFRKAIPKRIKKIIFIFGLSLLSLFLIYSIAVTISRFGETNQSSTLLRYFGIPMLTFNYGLSDSICNFADGKYFFDWFLPFFGISPLNFSTLGSHFGTAFFTFVGAWYIDFGPVGTFIIAIIFPIIIIGNFRYKRKIYIADLYLYLFYVNYLAMGVFVVGRGNSLAWLMAFIIYGILKITT